MMNQEEYSYASMLMETYQNASVPTALLDSALGVEWANAAALDLHPSLQHRDGFLQLLPSSRPEELLAASEPGPRNIPLPLLRRTLSLLPVPGETGYLLHSFPDTGEGPEQPDLLRWDEEEQLCANLSSQFRMPLSSIFSNLLFLRSKPALAEMPELGTCFGNIARSCYQIMRVSNELTRYLRVQTGGEEHPFVMVDLTALVGAVGEAVRISANRIGIPVHCTLPDHPILTRCDADGITEVLLQLAANSLRFTREDNALELTLRDDGSHVTVILRDSGMGIPAELQSRVFDPYFSYDGLGTPFAGVGLGLTLCRSCVRRHGGTIALTSEEDHGTTVVFTLPIRTEGESALRECPSSADLLLDRYSPVHWILSDSCPPPRL